MTRRKRSAFSARLQFSRLPRELISLNDSMSWMNGAMARPRPWMLAESEPPMVRRSAPVCFWANAHACPVGPGDVWRKARISGHWMPDSTSSRPRSPSNASTRFILRVSSISASAQNCCPPMAWRPPAMHTGRLSLRAEESSGRTASRLVGEAMRWTRVELSCEWTSLTRIVPGAGSVAVFAWAHDERGQGAAVAAVAAAVAMVPRRNFRRVVTRRILDELSPGRPVKLGVGHDAPVQRQVALDLELEALDVLDQRELVVIVRRRRRRRVGRPRREGVGLDQQLLRRQVHHQERVEIGRAHV